MRNHSTGDQESKATPTALCQVVGVPNWWVRLCITNVKHFFAVLCDVCYDVVTNRHATRLIQASSAGWLSRSGVVAALTGTTSLHCIQVLRAAANVAGVVKTFAYTVQEPYTLAGRAYYPMGTLLLVRGKANSSTDGAVHLVDFAPFFMSLSGGDQCE